MTQDNGFQKNPQQGGARTHHGSCHCGAVAYEATVDLAQATKCNCSFCTKYAVAGVNMKPPAFKLLKGQEQLSAYGREGSPNRRFFCKQCGVQTHGEGDVPELGGAFVSINVNTLDDVDPGLLTYGYWDGRHNNWMAGTRPSPWPIQATA
jgi:hypothetical protein